MSIVWDKTTLAAKLSHELKRIDTTMITSDQLQAAVDALNRSISTLDIKVDTAVDSLSDDIEDVETNLNAAMADAVQTAIQTAMTNYHRLFFVVAAVGKNQSSYVSAEVDSMIPNGDIPKIGDGVVGTDGCFGTIMQVSIDYVSIAPSGTSIFDSLGGGWVSIVDAYVDDQIEIMNSDGGSNARVIMMASNYRDADQVQHTCLELGADENDDPVLIRNVASPIHSGDAVNKGYIDDHLDSLIEEVNSYLAAVIGSD